MSAGTTVECIPGTELVTRGHVCWLMFIIMYTQPIPPHSPRFGTWSRQRSVLWMFMCVLVSLLCSVGQEFSTNQVNQNKCTTSVQNRRLSNSGSIPATLDIPSDQKLSIPPNLRRSNIWPFGLKYHEHRASRPRINKSDSPAKKERFLLAPSYQQKHFVVAEREFQTNQLQTRIRW